MTGLLKDVMHDRADSLDPPQLDVAAMVRDGEQRVARRRTRSIGLAGLAAAAAAVVAVGAPSLWPSGTTTATTTTSESPFAAAFDAHEPAYALGATVHVDGRTFDVGRDVVAMVQSDAGVVFTDREGAVWAADGDGAPLEVGRTHARHPSLETDGSLVAWTERDGEMPVYAVLDQSTGSGVVRSSLQAEPGMGRLRDERDPALVYAVDGGEVYVRDSRGLVAWDPATDRQRVVGAAGGFTVDDVKAGLIAHSVDAADGESTYRVGEGLGEGTVVPAWNGFSLSPDGRWLLGETDPDEAALFDTATGAPTDARVDGYSFFVGYGWADTDTYVGLGLNKPYDAASVDLLTCEVGGGCTVTASGIGAVDEGVVVPIGTSMDE
jgi:hypothetical protein